MNFSYANGQSITDIAKEIISLSNEYNIEITNLFKKLTGISTDTKEWIGTKATKYTDIVSLDKQQYIDFYNHLKEFSEILIDISENIDICVKKTQEETEYKGI